MSAYNEETSAYSEEMKMYADVDNIFIGIGLANYNNNNIIPNNYAPTKLKYGKPLIDAYFNPPNQIFLCGVVLWDGCLRHRDDSIWANILSHETMHYVLFKYIGNEARVKFDNISLKSTDYGNDGFSKKEGE